MVNKLIILGTAGNSRDVVDLVKDINVHSGQEKWKCMGFLDEDRNKLGTEISGIKVLGTLSSASKFSEAFFVNAIGSAENFWLKDKIISKTRISREKFATLIHPSASIFTSAKLGKGVVIFPNVTIASRVLIGDHVIILPNSVLNHDTHVGDYATIASGVSISGDVEVGRLSYLGANSAIKEGVNVGDYSIVGMGSIVLKDVPKNSVMVGNPARFLRKTREL